MFRKRNKSRTSGASQKDSAHPIDLLIAFCSLPDDQLFLDMALDFTGGGVTSTAASVPAARKAPSASEQAAIVNAAQSVLNELDWKDLVFKGNHSWPLSAVANLTLQKELDPVMGIDFESETSVIRRGIARVTGVAVAALREQGRLDDAFAAALMGGSLYLQGDAWMAARQG